MPKLCFAIFFYLAWFVKEVVFRLSFFFLVVKSDPIYWPTDWSINLIDWSIKTRQFILIGFVVVIVVLINCLYIEIESLRSLRFKISSHLNMSILSIESWNRSVVVVVNYFIQNDFLILFWCLLLNWKLTFWSKTLLQQNQAFKNNLPSLYEHETLNECIKS